MTPEPPPGADLTRSGSPAGALSDLPSSFPPWATKLAELYFSGTTSAVGKTDSTTVFGVGSFAGSPTAAVIGGEPGAEKVTWYCRP